MKNALLPCVLSTCVVLACTLSSQQPVPAAEKASQPSGQMPKGTNVNPDAGLVAEFTKRVAAYVKVRNDAATAAPDLESTKKPAEINTAEKSMASNVRVLRADAKRGDIFTPATEAMFRRMLKPPLAKGPDAADNKAIINDDAPKAGEVPFKVNGEYPKDVALSTVPPDVLASLPKLPEDIQYRFVGKHLILFDAQANLIIDYMLNAIP